MKILVIIGVTILSSLGLLGVAFDIMCLYTLGEE